VYFHKTHRLLIRFLFFVVFFCIRQVLENKWEYNETVNQLFIDFKKACDSVRREGLYNIA
jgi:hypothetical protein